MQALGLIETKGLIAAVESADAMLKAANVSLIDKTYVGGGLVSISITGDVGAVKAAVEAGAAAVKQMNTNLLISEHVIPRPHEDIDGLIFGNTSQSGALELESSELEASQPEKHDVSATIQVSNGTALHKTALDEIVKNQGFEFANKMLDQMKVVELRHLAREYKDFSLVGRKVSQADKKTILGAFKAYYRQR